MLKDQIRELQDIIDHARSIVFFTGAGVSTDSGIPDFRSQDGLYNQQYQYPPETIISHGFYKRYPEEFYRFYKDKMLVLDAEPNAVHRFIAEAEKRHKSLGVVTQNIDGLHTKAGSQRVYELHGSVMRNYCPECGKMYPGEYVRDSEGLPRCSCGAVIKPDVVLYEEGLDPVILNAAQAVISSADVMIVLGTSLVVYPAAGLLQFFHGKKLVLINRDATPFDDYADLHIQASFSDIFPYLHI